MTPRSSAWLAPTTTNRFHEWNGIGRRGLGARQLGADEVIDHETTRFEHIVQKVDVVFDAVGGDMQERSLSLLLRGRKLVSIAKEPPKKRAADHGVTASTSQSSRTAINSWRSQSS